MFEGSIFDFSLWQCCYFLLMENSMIHINDQHPNDPHNIWLQSANCDIMADNMDFLDPNSRDPAVRRRYHEDVQKRQKVADRRARITGNLATGVTLGLVAFVIGLANVPNKHRFFNFSRVATELTQKMCTSPRTAWMAGPKRCQNVAPK